MKPAGSLAHHLAAAARRRPAALALSYAGQSLTFTELLADAGALGATLAGGAGPLVVSGSSLDLARHACACSLKNRPFWPVDRNRPAHWSGEIPPRVALVISTSGSEGEPRGVMLSDASLDAAAAAANRHLPLGPGDLWLDCLPLNHIGGLAILWRCFAAGAAVRLHEHFDAAAVWQDITAGRVSHVSLVPAMLARLLDLAELEDASQSLSQPPSPPSSLRCALIGGAALSRPLWLRAKAAGWPLFVSYGMSETAAQIVTLPPTDEWHEGLVGQPLPGVDIAIGNDGRVRVRSPQLMLGYLGETESGIEDGWLRTGDLGRINADGHLTLLGRADDVLVSAGVNIHPQEIEVQLAACPGIQDVAVTAASDPVWGDVLAALLVGNAEPDAVRDWSNEHLPSSLRPRRFMRVKALPRNSMGKLERRLLPAILAGGMA